MAKQPALSTQLKAANDKIAELEKQLKLSNDTRDSWYKQMNEAKDMIEQVHQVLDAVPNSIPRKDNDAESYHRVERTPVTRLAAWLAVR